MRIFSKLIVAVVCLATACLAQLDKASIIGNVVDSSGAVISGAKVEIRNVATDAAVMLTTDQSGSYAAPALSIGTYKVTVSAAGFKTVIQDGIRLNVADVIKLPFTLSPGNVNETLTVTGEAPVVDTASSTYGGLVTDQQVMDLPLNGRGLVSSLVTVPGVSMLGVEPSINGSGTGRLFEAASRILLDGSDSGQVDSDLFTGGYGTRARMDRGSVESVAEVRIQQSTFSAEYGQAAGGVTNFITKSGTNSLHGSLFEYFRNDVLDARDYFNPGEKPALRLNQFGGSIGGPIKRDKLFFFADYEGARQREATVFNGLVPTAYYRDFLTPELRAIIDRLPLPNGADIPNFDSDNNPLPAVQGELVQSLPRRLTEDGFTAKVDYSMTANDRVSVRYTYDHATNVDQYGVEDGQATDVVYQPQYTKINYTHAFSPTVLNEFGFGVNRLRTVPRPASNEFVRTETQVSFLDGTAQIGPSLWDLAVGNTSFTFLDTLSWAKGRHQLKFGTQIVRAHVNKYTYFERIAVFFGLNNNPAAGPALAFFDSNTPLAMITVGNPGVGQRETMYNFFAQDDFQATRNLTLNLGLRYQYETAPVEQFGRNTPFNFVTGQLDPPGTRLFDASKKNFGPRFGLAWTPFASKSFVVRGGYGLFFTSINPAMAQFEPTLNPDFGQFRQEILCVNTCGLQLTPPTDLTPFPSAGIFVTISRPYNTPYVGAWNLNVQQGLGQNTVLQVAYVGNRGVHYATFTNPNRVTPGDPSARPYPGFGDMIHMVSCCDTNYNALQASLRRRFASGLAFNVNYTYSHAFDNGEFGYGSQPNDNHRLDLEYASADYDIRHLLEFDYTYQIPAARWLPGVIGKGWQLNGISTYRSGAPVNIDQRVDSAMTFESFPSFVYDPRPNLVPGQSVRPANYSAPLNQLNPAAFEIPAVAPGNFGNTPRNFARGPWVFNNDLSLFKSFQLTERQSLQFRAEVFNIFNTPQFDRPVATIGNPLFGQSVATIRSAGNFFGSNRQIQFALKYLF